MSHPTKDWRDRFRKDFTCGHTLETSTCEGGRFKDDSPETLDKVIAFIQEEKDKSYREGRESLMEEVEKMKKNEHGDTIMPNSYGLIVDTFHEKKVYNKALDDILSIISNKK